jgi:hypothetical protein
MVAEELLAANGDYRSRCRAAEEHAAAMDVLNNAKAEQERQQGERIRNLEAELENVSCLATYTVAFETTNWFVLLRRFTHLSLICCISPYALLCLLQVRGHSWQHLEQLQQLEQAMQQAHDQLSQQSKELASKAQVLMRPPLLLLTSLCSVYVLSFNKAHLMRGSLGLCE